MKQFNILLLSLFISSCGHISYNDVPDLEVCVRQFNGAACTKTKSRDYYRKIDEPEYKENELGMFVIYPQEYARLTLFFRELCIKDDACNLETLEGVLSDLQNPEKVIQREKRKWCRRPGSRIKRPCE